jgi:hypothetical protein
MRPSAESFGCLGQQWLEIDAFRDVPAQRSNAEANRRRTDDPSEEEGTDDWP